MQCGHCSADYHPQTAIRQLGQDADLFWQVEYEPCPRCQRLNIRLVGGRTEATGLKAHKLTVVYPKGASRKPAPPVRSDQS